MTIITRKRLVDFMARHSDAKRPLELWYRTVRQARWRSIRDVRMVYPSADAVEVGSGKRVTVFNIGGHKYRLITAIHYNRQRVYVLRLMTHAEYSKDTWRGTL